MMCVWVSLRARGFLWTERIIQLRISEIIIPLTKARQMNNITGLNAFRRGLVLTVYITSVVFNFSTISKALYTISTISTFTHTQLSGQINYYNTILQYYANYTFIMAFILKLFSISPRPNITAVSHGLKSARIYRVPKLGGSFARLLNTCIRQRPAVEI